MPSAARPPWTATRALIMTAKETLKSGAGEEPTLRIAASEDAVLGQSSLRSGSKTFPQPGGEVAPSGSATRVDLTIPQRRISRPGGSVRACGKSTLLADPWPDGTRHAAARCWWGIGAFTGLRPAQRNVANGVQSYALYPHLSVAAGNIGFGLPRSRSLSLRNCLQDSLHRLQPSPAPWPEDSCCPGRRPSAGGSPRWPNNSGSHPCSIGCRRSISRRP